MAHQTVRPETTAPNTPPPDIVTMREIVDRLLDPDGVPEVLPPSADEVAVLTLQLRGHLQLLAPEVETASRSLKPGSVYRFTVLGCVWEARSRLEAEPSTRYGGPIGHARRLARVLNALCDHHEYISATTGSDRGAAS